MMQLNDIIQFWAPYVQRMPMWAWFTALVSLSLLWAWINGRRRLNLIEIDVDRLRHELRAMSLASVGVGGKVREIEKRQKQLKKAPAVTSKASPAVATTRGEKPVEKPVEKAQAKVVAIRPAAEEYNSHPYDYAIQLARHGSNANEIMYQSGISQNEAKLIHMLHSTKAG